MNQEEILALLQQKFPQLAPADLAPLASDLADQGLCTSGGLQEGRTAPSGVPCPGAVGSSTGKASRVLARATPAPL